MRLSKEYYNLLSKKDKRQYNKISNKYNLFASINIFHYIGDLLYKIIMFLFLFGLFYKNILSEVAFENFQVAVFQLLMIICLFFTYLSGIIFLTMCIMSFIKENKQSKFIKEKGYDKLFLELSYKKRLEKINKNGNK